VKAVSLMMFASMTLMPSAGPLVGTHYEYRVPYVSSLGVETLEPELCVASWYGGGEPLNDLTASGVPFDADVLAVASWDYPFGTLLEVSAGGRSVVVVVNDRGPADRLGRCLDLTRAAFSMLDSLDKGLLEVSYRIIREGN
jgi:rare lipoprotein A